MAPRVPTQRSPKRPLDLSRGYFYPGEVVRILRLDGADYRQLRALFKLVRKQAGNPVSNGGWARFTFRDLVALKSAVCLAGGVEALAAGRRLRLKEVEALCDRLRETFGIEHPLTEVIFYRRGRTIVAQARGLLLEPASGQMLLEEVETAVEEYLAQDSDRFGVKRGRTVRAKVRSEIGEMRKRGRGVKLAEAQLEVNFR